MAINFIVANPLISVISLSFLISLITTLVYKFTTDQNKLRVIREELKTIRKDMVEAKNDPKRMQELQSRSMEISMEQFKHGLKPMLITWLPAIIIFGFINKSLPADKIVWKLPFNLPKIGSNEGFGWLGVYILSSLVFSTVLRKLFKVY